MNRRGFFASLGVAIAAPRAIRLVPPDAFHGAALVPPLLKAQERLIIDLSPAAVAALPTSVMGRMEWIGTCLEEGWITQAEAARLTAGVDPLT